MDRPLDVLDPLGWLGGDVKDRRILCLGAGGGRHGPMLANAGARVEITHKLERKLLVAVLSFSNVVAGVMRKWQLNTLTMSMTLMKRMIPWDSSK